MKSIFNWLITSSADPKKTSLALKGVLTVAGAHALQAVTLACGLGLYCVGIDAEWVNDFVQTMTDLAYAVLFLFGTGVTLWGLLRKARYGRWSAAQ